ncbi:tetratricopeptide repeat protein [Kutzneria kofuensis]|uniref:Tetratricopeptide (TPR) repeat protein n=1 Tax=Kutzneria kofuensis TaxID=103725 RepID=A0A7W9KQ61_9PSEU|nr:tetratricopeptide repeat protein [Kutzneria kofuensis]MBB5896687.1 tetratricopeptide (TPR) repeat protein [Kutzneria kofuensis]
MSERPEPPLELRAALAFGSPLRDGLELVRGRHRGATVVLGWGDDCEQVVRKGDTVNQPVTADAINRAAGGDLATILAPSLDRIIRKHTELAADPSIPTDQFGSRHSSAQRYAKQTGWPVATVSEERNVITLFVRDSVYELRSLPELRTAIEYIRNLLHSTYALMQSDILVTEEVRRSRLIEVEAKLAKLDGHLIEFGEHGEDIRDDCRNIARLLGIEWEPTAAPPPPDQGLRGPAIHDIGQRTGTTNDFSGTAGTVVQAGSIETVNIFPATPALPTPRQLPPATTPFTDRVAVTEEIVDLLTAENASTSICVVVGGVGVGKSALLARCGHDLQDRFPDGVLHADLRGFHPSAPPVEPVDVLGGFLRDLGLAADAIPADLDGMVRLYRSRLHGRRVLVIFDNARDADQVRPLLPGTNTCPVLAASRNAMTNLVVREGAHRVRLPELAPDDAVQLLAELTAAPAGSQLAEMAELCAGNPLALRIAGSQAYGYSAEELKDFVDELRAERLEVLSLPDDDNASLRAAFSLSYKALPASTQRAFRLLGLYPGVTISTGAAEALFGDRWAIRALGDAHLIEQIGPRRYRLHSLGQAYATERALDSERPDDRRAALARVVDWFRRNAEAHGPTLDPWHPRTAVATGRSADRDQALKWFDDELVNFATVARVASDVGDHDAAWRFALACAPYFFSRKPWATWILVQEAGLAAARAASERDGEAWLCDSLAVAYREQRRHDDAVRHLVLALELFEEAGNPLGTAQSSLHLAQTYRELGDLPLAADAANAALAAFRTAGSAHGEARAENLLGGIASARGEHSSALAHTERAMKIFDEQADEHGYSWAVNNLGLVLAKLGRYEQAVDAFTAALRVRQRIDRYGLAFTYEGLGDVHRQLGSSAEARRNWQHALEIFDVVGDPRAERLRTRIEALTDDHAPADATAASRKLRHMSDGLAAELDRSSGAGHAGEHHLSTGLYVRRTRQAEVIELLRPDNYPKPLLIHGSAGQGKSSLLWALYQELAADTTTQPYLLNSPWLAFGEAHAPSISTAELRQAAEQALADGRVAVFLIDTVDLLLHDDLHGRELADLCETLTDAGAEVVLTSRPEEAERLPKPSFRRIGLASYDEVELPLAVASHVAAFCPRSMPESLDEKVGLIVGAVARGLAVSEVVRNPLTLRLLFELYADEFPLLEHDVSSLYQEYWRRRVETDKRSEVAPGAGRDLSASVGHLAIALLGAGRIERNEQLLLQSAATVAAAATGTTHKDALVTLKIDVDLLVSRGVLIRTERGIRFFHQTGFEYAAALGLLVRDGVRALVFLRDHVDTQQDDLFVGAILEQLLIVALDRAPLADETAAIIREMAVAAGPTLPRVALAALAHRPRLMATTEQLLDTVSLTAVRRYVQTMPTVADADPRLQVTLLGRAWKRGDEVHESVLESLERLGGRDASGVRAMVAELGCVDVALGRRGEPAKVIQLTARVIVAAASADPAWARQQLLTLFDDMIQRNTHRAVPLYLIELIADRWAVLGSAEAARDIRTRIVEAQGTRDASAGEMRKALGHIEALAWRDDFAMRGRSDEWWWTAVEELCERLEHDFYDVLGNARLLAVAELIITDVLGPERAVRTVTRLAELTGSAPFALNRSLYAPLFAAYDDDDDNPVAPVVPILLSHLDGLPAPGNKPAEGAPRWAYVARQALHDSGSAADRVAALLADVPSATHLDSWLLDDHLAVLLVPAAIGGHPVAAAALDQVSTRPDLLSPIGQKNVSYDLVRHLPSRPDLVALLIELSILRVSSTPLSEVLVSHDNALLAELRRASVRLSTLLDRLFDGGASGTKEAVSLWRRLYRAGVVQVSDLAALQKRLIMCPDPAARGNILQLAVDAALAGELDGRTVDAMLRGLFRKDGGKRTITSPDGSPAGHVATTARAVWLRLVCMGDPTDAVDVDEVLDIAAAAPATTDNLTVLGHLITRLAEQGSPAIATRVLLRVAETVTALGFSRKQENGVANKLRTPIRAIFRHSALADQRALLALAPTLPRTHARILVAAAAQERFFLLRPDLAALLAQDLPEGVAQQIQDDMAVRSRTEGTGAMPRLLRPLADDQQA